MLSGTYSHFRRNGAVVALLGRSKSPAVSAYSTHAFLAHTSPDVVGQLCSAPRLHLRRRQCHRPTAPVFRSVGVHSRVDSDRARRLAIGRATRRPPLRLSATPAVSPSGCLAPAGRGSAARNKSAVALTSISECRSGGASRSGNWSDGDFVTAMTYWARALP